MKLRNQDRIALVVVLVLAIVGAYYMLALKPEKRQAAALATQIATERQTLAQAEQNFSAGRAAQASLKTDAAQWAALRLAVPSQSDIPGLLRTLEQTARSAGVAMKSITLAGGTASPSTSAPAPASGASTTGTAGAAASAATGVPVQLSFAGGYAALDRLVAKLNGLVTVAGAKVRATGPLLSVSSVSMSGAPKLTVQLNASIYQLDAPPTAGATTGG